MPLYLIKVFNQISRKYPFRVSYSIVLRNTLSIGTGFFLFAFADVKNLLCFALDNHYLSCWPYRRHIDVFLGKRIVSILNFFYTCI